MRLPKPSLLPLSPDRFLFLLLGPNGKGPQYHEIGRSIATLMTDEVSVASDDALLFLRCGFSLAVLPLSALSLARQIFHDVAYKAKDRNDLLSGIDEFLDQVTVLPPGEWDPTIRIEPPKSVPSQVRLLLVHVWSWRPVQMPRPDVSLSLSVSLSLVVLTGEEENPLSP